MSRTSRRVSRPLIAALAIVVILFVVFTLNKVHKARAQVAAGPVVTVVNTAGTSPTAVAPHAPPAAPKTVTVLPPTTAPSTSPETHAGPEAHAEDNAVGALVTQTPTEKVSATPDPTPQIQPQSQQALPVQAPQTSVPSIPAAAAPDSTGAEVAPPTAPASNESTATDNAALQNWAKGGAKQSNTPPGHVDMPLLPVTDAKTKLEAGDLISARQILNDNLIAGRGDAEALKKQIEQINMDLIFSARKFPQDPWGGSYQVAGGERLGSIAARNNVTWEFLSRINGVTPRKLRSGQWIKIAKGPFYAVVTKHAFTMDLYLGAPGGPGSMFVRTFQVGLGKDNSTPTGLWMCKAGDKIRNPRYYPPRGGDVIAPDDPKNPLNGYWIAIEGLDGQALGKESYGIHGTIDPDSIGKMASMGCIRLRADEISWVFDLLVDGKSKVMVKD